MGMPLSRFERPPQLPFAYQPTSEAIGSATTEPPFLNDLAAQRRVLELLRDGVAAAKSGQRVTGRRLLQEVTAIDPQNELAWLWLSGLADSPHEAAAYLRRVLMFNPKHPQARDGMKLASMQAGIAAAKAGHRALARHHFRAVLEVDSRYEEAWLHLASVADSPDEGIAYLQRALAINPSSSKAWNGLKWLQQRAQEDLPPEDWQL